MCCLKRVIFRSLKYYTLKEVLRAINLSLSLIMDPYTRHYVNQSDGGEIGPVYRARFRVQRGKVKSPNSEGYCVC